MGHANLYGWQIFNKLTASPFIVSSNLKILDYNIEGIVIDKFVDSANHCIERIVVLNFKRKKAEYYLYNSDLYSFISNGDSLYKKSNSMDCVVIKENVKYNFSLCIYKWSSNLQIHRYNTS